MQPAKLLLGLVVAVRGRGVTVGSWGSGSGSARTRGAHSADSSSAELSRPSWPPDPHAVPLELLDEARRRLGLLATVLLVGDVIAWIIPLAVRSIFEDFGDPYVHMTAHITLLSGSALVAFVSLRKHVPTRWTLDLALVYQVFACAAIATLVNVRPWPETMGLPSWSLVAVLTLVAPIVVPTTPGRAWVAAIVGASCDPIAVLFHAQVLGTMEQPPAGAMLFRFLPNILAVPVAIAVGRIVHRLRERLAEAHELGSYRLIEPIGQGGMGEVWRATHRLLARPAAVKLIRTDLRSDDPRGATARRRFEREARVIATLCSPHTIQLYDYGVGKDGTLYYVMELLRGEDLSTLVDREGALEADRVVDIARQVCRSLEEAHTAGLVHRDIKPGNIFVCDGGVVKVLDFGLVRDGSDPGESLTKNGAIVGTPAYMPPEMALGDALDGRTDLYGLGCVMYYALTGLPVFAASGAMAAAVAHVSLPPSPPTKRTTRKIPPELEALVMRLLSKDPDQRPESAEELEGLLAALGRE